KGGRRLRRYAFNLSVLAALCGAPAFSYAVDSSLHRLPPDVFEVDVGALAAEAEATQGVDVTDVRDLGAKPKIASSDDLPPEDIWERIRRGFAMPELDGPLVVERQAWYAARPAQIRIMAERSKRYLFYIVEELERRGMPTELALLPMVESAMNPLAHSSARASGLWQFIPSTGKHYKLQQNWWYDARRDIVASTNAALDYLQFLYNMHGDWQLALASYNMGENGVMRAMERNRVRGKPTSYEHLSIPRETQYYVPKLQALKNIIANPAAFGIDLDPIPNAPYFVTVELTRDVDLTIAAKLAEMPVDELVALNPGHNRPVVSSAVSPQLVLPADRATVFVANLEEHKKPLSTWQTYTYKSGDKLDRIAKQNGITVAKLREINRLGPKAKVAVGQLLLLPLTSGHIGALPLNLPIERAASKSKRNSSVYTVRRGDTLYAIANRFDVDVDDLKRWNGGRSQVSAGQKLRLTAPAVAKKASTKTVAKSKDKSDQLARGND
ncbi:MAG TPA: transglycosylase SLT domain-containing protein, partial [Burkholderiales bacterium]|nr:transglycosylase SLT domain-containing protein [Burkholderiales bacterium]